MLFHEIYGLYYKTMARIIDAALEERLTAAELCRIAAETAFSETALTIESALKAGRWPLVNGDGYTPLISSPDRPMTLLERRWLKAIALDPRVGLFGEFDFDDDVAPLFRPEDIAVYDRFGDGDPYDSPKYREIFQTVLTALRERRSVEIVYFTQRGVERTIACNPYRLEYSAKDDKFRLITHGKGGGNKINLGRIESVRLRGENDGELREPSRKRNEYVLDLLDERNALERAMLHFADLEKRTERLAENRYRMTLKYDVEDETELVIRVLSFGPMLHAVAPEHFVNQIRTRLARQRSLRKINKMDEKCEP